MVVLRGVGETVSYSGGWVQLLLLIANSHPHIFMVGVFLTQTNLSHHSVVQIKCKLEASYISKSNPNRININSTGIKLDSNYSDYHLYGYIPMITPMSLTYPGNISVITLWAEEGGRRKEGVRKE